MLLNYDDNGPGPVVVLLHGFPLDRTLWAAQVSAVGATYRVITPDLRGHGKSAAPEGVYPIDAMADDVIETLDALQIAEPVVIGGLSMGGYVALSLVLRYPGRFRALILADTKAAADTAEEAARRETLARAVEAAGDAGPAVEAMLPRLFAPGAAEDRPKVVKAARRVMEKTPARAVAGALRGMAARPDRTADLGSITVPTLVLVGAEDAVTPPEEARGLAAKLPRATLEVVAGAGHLTPLEAPEAVNRALLAFLDRLEAEAHRAPP